MDEKRTKSPAAPPPVGEEGLMALDVRSGTRPSASCSQPGQRSDAVQDWGGEGRRLAEAGGEVHGNGPRGLWKREECETWTAPCTVRGRMVLVAIEAASPGRMDCAWAGPRKGGR